MTRHNFTPAQRRAAYERAGHICQGKDCGRPLSFSEAEIDHVQADGLCGPATLDNAECLCGPCHLAKTKTDVKRISKAKRQALFHTTGRSSAKQHVKRIQSKGFDKTWRKKMNGTVERVDA